MEHLMQQPEEISVDDLGTTVVKRETRLPGPLGLVFTAIHRLFEAAAIALFVAIVIVAVLQVVNRFFIGSSLSWSEEFQRYGHIWLVFFAVPIGYRRGSHIGIDFLQRALRGGSAKALEWLLDLGWLILGVIIVYSTLLLLGVASRQHSPGIGLSMDKIYFGFVLGGGYLVLTAIDRMLQKLFGVAE
jgi:TRAP-type C4-dicarboxylate transport system permease small subunit